jgi:transposase
VAGLIAIVRNDEDERVPDMARRVPRVIGDAIVKLDTQIAGIEAQIMAWHRSNPMSQRLAAIPGIGPIIATAIAATVAEPGEFHGGREFAAWLGLVPRQNSTGGKTRLGAGSANAATLISAACSSMAPTPPCCLQGRQD